MKAQAANLAGAAAGSSYRERLHEFFGDPHDLTGKTCTDLGDG